MFLIYVIFLVNIIFLLKSKIKFGFKDLFIRNFYDLVYSVFVTIFFFLFLCVYKFFVPQREFIDTSYYYEIIFCFFKYHFFLSKNSQYASFFGELILVEFKLRFFLKSKYFYYYFLKENGFHLIILCYFLYFYFLSSNNELYVGFLKYYAMYYFFLRFMNFLPRFCSDFDEGITSFYSNSLCITKQGFYKLHLYSKYLVYNEYSYYFVPSIIYNFNLKFPQDWVFFSHRKYF